MYFYSHGTRAGPAYLLFNIKESNHKDRTKTLTCLNTKPKEKKRVTWFLPEEDKGAGFETETQNPIQSQKASASIIII